MIGNVTFGGCT